MNHGPLIFLGIFLAFLSAWIGLVVAPTAQLQRLLPATLADGITEYPRAYSATEQAGRRVYQAEGCLYCHTQQLRGGQWNADLARGWGDRRSEPLDYIRDYPVLLGTMRTGPDLLNVAARRPDAAWHHKHLYDPQLITPGSNMEPFRYLYKMQPISPGGPTPGHLDFGAVWITPVEGVDPAGLADELLRAGFIKADQRKGRLLGFAGPQDLPALRAARGVAAVAPYVPDGWEIVPTPRAEALVAYLLSLNHTYRLQDLPAATEAKSSPAPGSTRTSDQAVSATAPAEGNR